MALTLTPLTAEYAVCRLHPSDAVPPWALSGEFFSVSRSPEELSVTCEAARVPPGLRAEGPWRALKLEGPFDFALTGILASVLNPLAQAGIGIFALSTFDTDYVLVKAEHFAKAVRTLRAAGHTVHVQADAT